MTTDIRQTSEYAKYLKSLGWKVERRDKVNYFIKTFPIIGSVIKIQRPEEIRYKDIEILSKKYRAFQIIIEPKSEHQVTGIESQGFRLSKSPYLPTKTLLLDLTQSKEKLFSQMKKDAFSAIKKSAHIEIREVRTNKDIEIFKNSWRKSVGIKRFVPPVNQLLHLKNSFTQNPPLFLASHNMFGRIIGGAIFTRVSHGSAYYWQAFTNNEGRSTLSQYSLVLHGILWAKSQKCRQFDFEGIYDPRFPDKTWLGFTHFKKSFGGIIKEYPGAYTKLKFPFMKIR